MTWAPITTAPMDGTKILVTDGTEVDTAYWDYEDWCAPHSGSVSVPYTPVAWRQVPASYEFVPVFGLVGVDPAKESTDKTYMNCPVCYIFQELVSPDYLCKECGGQLMEDFLLGIKGDQK